MKTKGKPASPVSPFIGEAPSREKKGLDKGAQEPGIKRGAKVRDHLEIGAGGPRRHTIEVKGGEMYKYLEKIDTFTASAKCRSEKAS